MHAVQHIVNQIQFVITDNFVRTKVSLPLNDVKMPVLFSVKCFSYSLVIQLEYLFSHGKSTKSNLGQ